MHDQYSERRRKALQAYSCERVGSLIVALEKLGKGPPIKGSDRLIIRKHTAGGLLEELIERPAEIVEETGIEAGENKWGVLYVMLRDVVPEVLSVEELEAIDRDLSNGQFGEWERERERKEIAKWLNAQSTDCLLTRLSPACFRAEASCVRSPLERYLNFRLDLTQAR